MPIRKKSDKELQKKQNMITFIDATTQMIEEVGIANLSIRKIAEKAGFHNSTIYLYFEDLDELLILASIKFFQEYSQSLGLLSKEDLSPGESLIKVWDSFLTSAFKWSYLFHNFFFGKRSDHLSTYMDRYYDLYPEERIEYSNVIKDMYYGENISERCLKLLQTALPETSKVTEDNIYMICDIIISFCKYKLEQKCQDPTLDNEKLKEECLHVISFVTGIS